MKVAFVVPRYGDEVIGGAERAAQQLAERLVAARGWPVEVLTTCAVDYRTWANAYPPGTTDLRGVRVVRFASARGRSADFDAYSAEILPAPTRATDAQQWGWIDRQGPVCPDLIDAVAATDAALVTFHPYLYAPTVLGISRVAPRAVLHPSAHDELPIHLPLYREVFTCTRALVFWTGDEQRLANRLFPVVSRPQIVLGLGVEAGAGETQPALQELRLEDRPYLLYLGRVDDAKGTGPLVHWFSTYKERRPGPLALVLVGPVIGAPRPHPDVVLSGPVDESTKWGLLRGATVLVAPSRYESFSLALLEGWSAGVPALVNGACAVTREHCRRSGGGLWFEGYAQFEAALDLLTGSRDLRDGMAACGSAYVADRYTWPCVIERYASFLETVAGFVA